MVEPENIADWEYTEEDDGTITLTSYKGTDTTVIIPNSINGKKVKNFREQSLQAIILDIFRYGMRKFVMEMNMIMPLLDIARDKIL